ncbi:MAG TPA: hypothetical protein VNB94_06835 [Mycobacteriales bacterium]|nr:hypothetical protein [Mycobacteriales bacterium]
MVTTVELVRAHQAELRASAARAAQGSAPHTLRDAVRRIRHRTAR